MNRITMILAAALAGSFALPASAMGEEDLRSRMEAQMKMKTMQAASVKTREDGTEEVEYDPEVTESGYRAMPAEASIDLVGLTFERNNTKVAKGSAGQIDALCAAMKSMDSLPSIQLIGHTDKSGGEDVNLRVSAKRANAVRAYMDENCGIPAGMILTIGEGEAHAPESTPSNNPADRRVEVQVIG